MNWDQIEGKWDQAKGKVKEKWGQLTDDDLTEIRGKRDQLAGRIQDALRIYQGARGRGIEGVGERHTMVNRKV